MRISVHTVFKFNFKLFNKKEHFMILLINGNFGSAYAYALAKLFNFISALQQSYFSYLCYF